MSVSLSDLLQIENVEVLNSEINEREISMEVEISYNYAICHKCGQKATEFHGYGETLRLRHLPVFNRPVYLYLRTKRFRCLNCDDHPTTTQRGDWYDAQAHCTKAYAEYLLLEIVNSTLIDVARKQGVAYDVLRGLVERYVSDEVEWSQFERLRVIGLDEIALKKGQRDYVTIITTRDETNRPVLLAVLAGREKQTVSVFLRSIPRRLRATIEQACTDLYEGYVNAVKEVLPQAQVVADRFHLAKHYRAAVDSLRKTEMRQLKSLLKPEEYAGLKGVMWLLRRKSADLTDAELAILELLFECSPLSRKAYALREKLDKIFEARQTKQAAERKIRAWISEVQRKRSELL
jgi:transposase